jgi:uncharacterized protein YfaS (alpha-2-macroglobulin family)
VDYRPPHRQRFLTVLLVMALAASACSGSDGDNQATPSPTPDDGASSTGGSSGEGVGSTTDDDAVLSVQLSEGVAAVAATTAIQLVEGEPATEQDEAALFDRVPPIPTDIADEVDFNRPAQTLPPPTAGDTVDQAFPPAVDDVPPVDVKDEPLEVLRFQPDGAVDLAPTVSVTFDQPMVPIGTLGQLGALDVPATLTPSVPGYWEWIGTRTLRFQPELRDRFPMASRFEVTIPAGTASVTGGELDEDVTWTFSTPAPQVIEFSPQGAGQPLSPVFVVVFDQDVDSDAVIGTIEVTANGDPRDTRAATADEIADDDAATRVIGRAGNNRWVAFTTVEPLEPDTETTVTVGPEVPSAEGALTDMTVETYRARTFAPLRVAQHACEERDCRPDDDSTWIRFTNIIDAGSFDPAAWTIEPAVSGFDVFLAEDTVFFRGTFVGRTEYEVAVPQELADVWGQTFGEQDSVTVRFGAAQPWLRPVQREYLTIDPFADPVGFNVASTNHDNLRVEVFEADPNRDWERFRLLLESGPEDGRGDSYDLTSWSEIDAFTVEPPNRPDAPVETFVDLGDALPAGQGHVLVLVSSTVAYDRNSDNYWRNRPILVWVQATSIGLDAVVDNSRLHAWATDLTTGQPLSGLEVSLDGAGSAETDDDGLAVFDLPSSSNVSSLLTATDGTQTSILPEAGGRRARSNDDATRWYVIDDRSLYRPGETANIKGWVRRLTLSADGQLAALGDAAGVSWIAYDARFNEITSGAAGLSAVGGFDLEFEIPEGANLGTGWIEFSIQGGSLDGQGFQHNYGIQDFRRPEFEVTTRIETPAPHVRTDRVSVVVEADYFTGGALPDADVEWTVDTFDTTYAPPGWAQYTFGMWVPWWLSSDVLFETDAFNEEFFDGPFVEPDRETFSGRTDGNGQHVLQLDFDGDVDQPTSVVTSAAVTDVNRQRFASSSTLLVHPGSAYVGLRSDRTFVKRGDPLAIEAIVTDIDGAQLSGRDLALTAERLEWRYEGTRWDQVPVDPQQCPLTSGPEPLECRFTTDSGGTYRITALVTDEFGRASRTEITRWVSGGSSTPDRGLQLETLITVPDRETYAAGDVAQILVEAPFEDGTGLVTVARNGILETSVITFDGTSAVVDVPITEDHVPGVEVQIEVVGATTRTADDGTPLPDAVQRPAFATGHIALVVPPVARTLSVDAVPAAADLAPGSDTSVDIVVTDADGQPVPNAELAVIVVDEAVLALTNRQQADPIGAFYQPVRGDTRTYRGRSSILLIDPEAAAELPVALAGDDSTEAEAAEEAEGDFAGADGARAAAAPSASAAADEAIDLRTNFDALAVFEPEVVTDVDGRARIAVPLPDNLTRYRVMVVAADGADRFGSGESSITARLPLQVRPSPPRFANFGDTFELPVVLQNQTGLDLDVVVGARATNLDLTAETAKRVTVPANDRIEVRFDVATTSAGTARVQVAAMSDDLVDAAAFTIPVYTPATAEAFATYGVLDDGATVVQRVVAPVDVWPQFGGLEINTSSTAVQALTDAVLYVHDYRYASTDGLASRILAVVALRDVLDAFDADGLPGPEELEANVGADIADLVRLQNNDGGFAIWRRDSRSWPYHSVHVAHALVEADKAGFGVPDDVLERVLQHIAQIEDFIPADYSARTRATIRAYALHVSHLAGRGDPAGANALWNGSGPDGTDHLSMEAIAWLWPVINADGSGASADASIERLFTNRVVETAGAATFTTDYGEDGHLLLHSDRRTDGVVLDALVSERPASDLLPKVVAGLLGNQTSGRWQNMQENTFILLALNRYFTTFENEDPDFVARVWLGDQHAAEHVYAGRTTNQNQSIIPTRDLVAGGDDDLIVSQDGEQGRLYYRLGLRYAPSDLDLEPLDRGFVVTRTYEAVDNPDDVRLEDGVWRIRAGAEVRVRISMVADSRRTHVALIDPLPAGLEPLNPALDNSPEPGPELDRNAGGFFGPSRWFSHQNLRDDRGEAFASFLSAGTYQYSYVTSATTPGTFIVPPSRAEEIFAPETFGRSGTDIVVVED